jgi:hypothetical protein
MKILVIARQSRFIFIASLPKVALTLNAEQRRIPTDAERSVVEHLGDRAVR